MVTLISCIWSIERLAPVFNGRSTNGPLSVCALWVVHYSCALFLYFHCGNLYFFILHFFHTAPFPCCTFLCSNLFMLYFFRVVLFLCIALFHVPLLHVEMFSFCILLLLHNTNAAIFPVALCSFYTISSGVANTFTNI